MSDDIVKAHNQSVSHKYNIKYPSHGPREKDPHKHDFLEWKKRRKETNTYYCDFAHLHRNDDFSECDDTRPLEAHHDVIEMAMANEVDFTLLEKDYPGISADNIGAWIDSDDNLVLLCAFHHRGHGGIHVASSADYEASEYIRGLLF